MGNPFNDYYNKLVGKKKEEPKPKRQYPKTEEEIIALAKEHYANQDNNRFEFESVEDGERFNHTF